jgi:hypothetical protein
MRNREFFETCYRIMNQEREGRGIGTLGEKTLHSILKNYLEPNTGNHEVKIGNYVADIINENGIIEIQTGGFQKLRKKLEFLLNLNTVTLVYPVARTKWIIWIDKETGETTKKRKSPKKGTSYEVFFELYKIKHLLANENLRLKILMLDIKEYRNLDGWSKDKKKGSTRYERIPTGLVDEICISSVSDFSKLIPVDLPDIFMSKDFKKVSGLSIKSSQTALNILNHLGVVERIGKQGNALSA